jgi:NAD(P)-dependent dehydrogenase (short-subunit alcohol dehydrogenase family)
MTPMTFALRPETAVVESDETMRIERRTRPDDVASAAVFLASDDARFITGESLLVDGGLIRAGGPSAFANGKYGEPQMIQRSGGS